MNRLTRADRAAMKQPPYEQMSRTDLLREIHSVQAALGIQAPLRIIAQELQVHQE
jgi:hypothetical protein